MFLRLLTELRRLRVVIRDDLHGFLYAVLEERYALRIFRDIALYRRRLLAVALLGRVEDGQADLQFYKAVLFLLLLRVLVVELLREIGSFCAEYSGVRLELCHFFRELCLTLTRVLKIFLLLFENLFELRLLFRELFSRRLAL